ncbi:MAG: penicillin-binding transpeptidase domain-containing protein [Saprospiraceae bacterium]
MEKKYRYHLTIGIFAASLLFLLVQLSIIQVFSDKYKSQANRTTIYKKDLEPSRGMIYDRNKKLLVANDPMYDINVVYNEIDFEMDTTLFCTLLSIQTEDFIKNLSKNWNNVQFQKNLPFTFLSGIPPKSFLKFQEHLFQFPGFYPVLNFKRKYVYPHAAHALGYIGEVGNARINRNPEMFSSGDYIGVSGIERRYDAMLRGEKGVAYVLKDNIGREVSKNDQNLIQTQAQPGLNLNTTIDIDLQAYGEELMKFKKGSIVAIEPKTGEILSIISSPSYDPNDLSIGRHRGASFKKLVNDTLNKPLLDRSVLAQYPPGSIFKPILSLIALQEGITYPGRTIECTGVYDINKEKGYSQGCRNHPIAYNMKIALEHSCNTYYYKLMGETVEKFGYNNPDIGLAMINKYLNQFGMGRKLDSDISNESTGFIPTPEYYDYLYRTVRTGWKASYILSLGIGQGELQMTTLQMANLAVILANRGFYKIPHLVQSLENNKPNDEKYSLPHYVDIDQKHFIPVLEGLERVMKTGTGRFSRIRGIPTCGKTGTSENPFGKDHSVFFAFAPKDDPQIAIAVYVENAGGGGTVAAPIGSLIIEKYLKNKIPLSRLYLEKYIKEINLINTP